MCWRKIAITLTTTGQPAKAFSSEEYFTRYWKRIGIREAGACVADPDRDREGDTEVVRRCAKNRRCAADPDGQRQDCHQRKGRALAKSTSRVAEVRPQGFDPTRYGPGADHVRV